MLKNKEQLIFAPENKSSNQPLRYIKKYSKLNIKLNL